jgi:hypothetical protein
MPSYVSNYLSTKQAQERKCSYCQVTSVLSQAQTRTIWNKHELPSFLKRDLNIISTEFHLLSISISFSFQPNTKMRSCQRALFTLFALICLLILMCSLLSFNNEMRVRPRDRNQPRRLLLSFTSFSANSNQLGEAMKDPKKSVKTSLRKAPPSQSNPSQNR